MMVNGQKVDSVEGENVTMLLHRLGLNFEKLVVEVSGEIIPRANYGDCRLEENAVIEIVSFVGGG